MSHYGAFQKKEYESTTNKIAWSQDQAYEFQLQGMSRIPERKYWHPSSIKKQITTNEVLRNRMVHRTIIGEEKSPQIYRMGKETVFNSRKTNTNVSNTKFAFAGFGQRAKKSLRIIPSAIRKAGGIISKTVGTNAMMNVGMMKGAQKKSIDVLQRYLMDSAVTSKNVLNKVAGRLGSRAGRGIVGIARHAAAGISLALSKNRHGRG